MNDNATLSRATSRTSKQGSSVSRNQSLIRKHITPQDLKTVEVLTERFVAWKAIVKQLISYFEGIADIENNTAEELSRLGGVIQVPFKSGTQFLGEGGLQDIHFGIRDKTKIIAEKHADLGRIINNPIQHLYKVGTEIKAHIKNIRNDSGKFAINVAKERESFARCIADLTNSVFSYKIAPMRVAARGDPYIANRVVARQLLKQVNEENLLQASIITMQQNSAHFEEEIVLSLRSAWRTFEDWETRTMASSSASLSSIARSMFKLPSDREWISFSARTDHFLNPDTPLRDPANINYPSKEDPGVVPVRTGNLELKKRYTRTYKESYFVLTPAGFLHQYASSESSTYGGQNVLFTLFLPACTLGPPGQWTNKFHIEATQAGVATKGGSLGGDVHAWTFRGKSREDTMEWWDDIKMLHTRYSVANEQMERSGRVAADSEVRAAGYVSEGEEEGEGSSVDEDMEERVNEYGEVDNSEEPLRYDLQHERQTERPEHLQDVAGDGYAIYRQDAESLPRRLACPHNSDPRSEQEAATRGARGREHTQGREVSPVTGPATAESRFTDGE